MCSVEPNTIPTDPPEVVKTTVVKDPIDQSRMTVVFVVSAGTLAKAFEFARETTLVEEGLRIVRKEGLPVPGISERGIPVPCNAEGQPISQLGIGKQETGKKEYCSISHRYLGED